MQNDVRAFRSHGPGDAVADAAGGTRDESGLAVESHGSVLRRELDHPPGLSAPRGDVSIIS